MLYLPHSLRALIPHVPRLLRASYPTCSHVSHASRLICCGAYRGLWDLAPYALRALHGLARHVTCAYILPCFICLVPYVHCNHELDLTCLVLYVLSCFIYLMPYMPCCATCFVPHAHSCITCLRCSSKSLSWVLRVLMLLMFRALHALLLLILYVIQMV